MATIELNPTDTGNTGALAADTIFHVSDGWVDLSTDGGATYIPFRTGEKVVFSSGLTVSYRNDSDRFAIIHHMPI